MTKRALALLLVLTAACNASPEDDRNGSQGQGGAGGDASFGNAVGPGPGTGTGSAGDFGATPGGVQDLSFARTTIEAGRVPPAEAFLVEAMFSEHDLPLDGPDCSTTLCLRGAMGVAPNAKGDSAAWVQVGMSSNVDPNTFERPSVAVVATVDVSGSMSWGYGDHGTPGEIARSLLLALTKKLKAADRFAMVTYGTTVSTPLDWVSGNAGSIEPAIAALAEDGSTNMEAGLERAFALAEEGKGTADEVRVMLFTDEQPNVGATTASEFKTMTKAAADKGIGLTVFGVGLGLGAEVMNGMSHLRGGNAFTLQKPTDVEELLEDSWPWMVSPLAFDMKLALLPKAPLELAASYGFPGSDGEPSAALDVASVFLSKRRGALLVELSGLDLAGSKADIDLSYFEPNGTKRTQRITSKYEGEALDERGVYMPQVGTAKTVALALLVSGLQEAAKQYGEDPDAAIEVLGATLDRFAADAEAIGDADLDKEAAFWPKLLELMEAGASQESFYGGF